MSKIAEWRNAKKVHADLLRKASEMRRVGFVEINANHGVDIVLLGDEWKKSRNYGLYDDLLDFSRQKVSRLAREALAEVDSVKVDAMKDIESIGEAD